MAVAGEAHDRLPWIEPAPAQRKAPAAARTARGPLIALLALFGMAAVAVLAFVIGRGTAPEKPAAKPSPILAEAAPPPQPPQPAPVVAPPPEAAAPPPVAASPPPVVARAVRARSPARAKRAHPRRIAVQRHVRPVQLAKAAPRVVVHHAVPTPAPRYPWPVAAPVPSGRVVQLGAYYTGAQTLESWRRLRQAYPYLATLPRKVMIIPPIPGRPRIYRLRIGAPSPQLARALCDNLHRIGRSCIVV